MRRLHWMAALGAAAILLSGCGEIANRLTPAPHSADTITVALEAPPNASQVGFFTALEQRVYAQADLDVHFVVSPDPIAAIVAKRAQLAASNEPQVLLTRNGHTAVAAVAAVLQGPEGVEVSCAGPAKPRPSRGGTSTTPTPRLHPPLHPVGCTAKLTPRPARFAGAPTYNGLNLVVTENEIINHAGLLRRFIQATARGYSAVESDPIGAARALVAYDPMLHLPAELAAVRASLPDYFPPAGAAHPWGWQAVAAWNAFGSWLLEHRIITNPNATPAAVTNELLAGQGV